MRNWLNTYKPAAAARTHLLLAALMWTIVGVLLLSVGAHWLLAAPLWLIVPLLALALVLGLLKARFVLKRTVTHMIERIRSRGDDRCLGGFLSLRSWGFVVLMIAAGRWLRSHTLPHDVIGLLYVAIGSALMLASCQLWHAWYRQTGR